MHKRQLKVKAFSSAHAGSKARHSAEQSPASQRSGDAELSKRRRWWARASTMAHSMKMP